MKEREDSERDRAKDDEERGDRIAVNGRVRGMVVGKQYREINGKVNCAGRDR